MWLGCYGGCIAAGNNFGKYGGGGLGLFVDLLVSEPQTGDGYGSRVKFEGTLLGLVIDGDGTFGKRY